MLRRVGIVSIPLCIAIGACSSGDALVPMPLVTTAAAATEATSASLPTEALPPPAFGPEVASLRVRRSISVRVEPRADSDRYGTVARDTRVLWKGAVQGPDCELRWIELEPRGFVCETYLEPTTDPPHGVELPKLYQGDLVPGEYAKFVADQVTIYRLTDDGMLLPERTTRTSMTVRNHGQRFIDGLSYWRISQTEPLYVPTAVLRSHTPSQFHGTRLGDDTGLALPVGFPLHPRNASHSVTSYSAAVGGVEVRKLAGRAPLLVLETATGDDQQPLAYRIGENEWIRAAEMRVARVSSPPATIEAHERWIDVDADEQVLVAYEGQTPVFATLVSTGSRRHPTAPGVHRIWIKFAELDMTDLGAEDPYSVATVPWTQFYAPDLALHTAYWHDTFGTQRSHGCTNLAPLDARFLYFWSEPQLPPGWSMANGLIERPGSLVRIRTAAEPAPEPSGYAAQVEAARSARDSPSDEDRAPLTATGAIVRLAR